MMEHQITKYRWITICLILALQSCYYDVEEEIYPSIECEVMDMSYQMDIQPLINSNCYVCHSAAANNGNVTLEGYDRLMDYVTSGQLLGAIRHEPGYSPMPKNGPQLLQCNIEKIESWIADGAPNN